MENIRNMESLRNYLDLLESKDLLTLIEGADWNLEIGAITELAAFSDKPRGLLFDKIKGYSGGYRVATDL
jgi:3-polyprenyl-4-hydroxybenzoate decarboxylase